MNKNYAIWVVLALILTSILSPPTPSHAQAPSIRIGDPAPEIKLEKLLQAPSDAQTSATSLKGKVVVLEFWATWCWLPASSSQDTGGQVHFPNSLSELDAVYDRIAEELRTQYSLGYTSNNGGGTASGAASWCACPRARSCRSATSSATSPWPPRRPRARAGRQAVLRSGAFSRSSRLCSSARTAISSRRGGPLPPGPRGRAAAAACSTQRAVEVGVEHRGVDVALAADGRRVAEPLGHRLDRARRRCASPAPGCRTASSSCRAQAASTVPAQVRKSLAVKSCAGDLAQVVVDVGRVDGAAPRRRRRGTGTAPGRAGPGSA